jgi:glycosyltransferase involved in cell wall biosynthesis
VEKSQVRIGIEGKVLSRKTGGIGRYAIKLMETLISLSAQQWPDLELVIFTAPQTDRALIPGLSVNMCERFRQIKSTLIRSSVLLPAGMLLEHIEVFHGLDQSGIPLFCRAGKHVVTIHDVIPLILPGAFPTRHRLVLATALARVRRQADIVIVPSHAAAEDVMRFLRVEQERIVVIPMGCEPRFRPAAGSACTATLRQRYALPERYILFVGTLEPRKNVAVLLQAFSRLLGENPRDDLKLVVAGGEGWGGMDIRARAEALKLRDRVIFTGFVDDDDLPDLYRGALMFVYPSLYEGFGLPILEAMACGIPVITSNRSSLPEVAGDAALLIDPTRPEDLAAAIMLLLCDGTRRQELRAKGIARARSFTWDAVAQQTIAIYRAVGGG